MRAIYVGHACWVFESGDVRLVTDPVFSESYHDGVFEVFPPREVGLDGLAPTHIVITHRHPDHFDPPTLDRLARRFPDAQILTSDALIVEVVEAFGFTHVRRIDAGTRLDLGALQIYTTPSHCDVEEWGLVVASEAGTLWNMVDTVLGDPAGVKRAMADAAAALGRPALSTGPDVALVRWCPLLQAQAVTAGRIGFPLAGYLSELKNAAATGATTLIPGSCGDRYVDAVGWLNQVVYPTTEARFMRDLRKVAPQATVFAPRVGMAYTLATGGFVESGGVEWIEVLPAEDDRLFAPFEIPALVDPAPDGFDEQRALGTIAVWVGDVLAPKLSLWANWAQPDDPLSFVLDLVFPTRTVALTLRVDAGQVSVDVGVDLDHDGLDRIAASVMLDVLEGRSHWGRALLGGWMRSVRRAVRVRPDGSGEPYLFPAFLVYLGLPYAESTERWVRAETRRLLAARDPAGPARA